MSISGSKSPSSVSTTSPPKSYNKSTANSQRQPQQYSSRSPTPDRKRSHSRSYERRTSYFYPRRNDDAPAELPRPVNDRSYTHAPPRGSYRGRINRYRQLPARYSNNYGYKNSSYYNYNNRYNKRSRSRSDSRGNRRDSGSYNNEYDYKRRTNVSPKRKRSPSSDSSSDDDRSWKKRKGSSSSPKRDKTEQTWQKVEDSQHQTAPNFSLKKISLPLTGSDQYFTEDAKDKEKTKHQLAGATELVLESGSLDNEDATKKENKEASSSISFSISKEDRLKKQILETKIFSQIHKPKAALKNATSSNNNNSM